MEFLRQEVKTFKGTDSKVIGRKFAGSLVAPVLCTRMVHAFFQWQGTSPDNQTARIISVRWDLKQGQRLRQNIEIWSRGQGEPDDFIIIIINNNNTVGPLVTCCHPLSWTRQTGNMKSEMTHMNDSNKNMILNCIRLWSFDVG